MKIGIIDIGSNTIKLLVARVEQSVEPLAQATEETRIATGISKEQSALTPEAMGDTLASVQALIAIAQEHAVDELIIVATSAVREATNQTEFADILREETGHHLRILSGEEEAEGIAQGILTDPQLLDEQEINLIDLGGGSLECIRITGRTIQDKVSLPLGAVRLTERYFKNPSQPIPREEADSLITHVMETFHESPFTFSTSDCPLVGVGGGLNVTRAMMAEQWKKSYETVNPFIPIEFIDALYEELSLQTIDERCKMQALPRSRADIIPAGLLTLSTIAHSIGAKGFIHSMRNLRFGIATKFITK